MVPDAPGVAAPPTRDEASTEYCPNLPHARRRVYKGGIDCLSKFRLRGGPGSQSVS